MRRAILGSLVALSLLVSFATRADTFRFSTVVNTPPYINVKDPPYNAKGDGVTDDTAAIQAALNARPGPYVFLPSGVYLLTGQLTIPSNAALIGMTGRNWTAPASVLKQTVASSATLVLPGGSNGVRLEHLTIYYSPNQGTLGGDAIVLPGNVNATYVEDVMIGNAYRGIVLSGNSNNANYFHAVDVYGCTSVGISIVGTLGGAPHIANVFSSFHTDGQLNGSIGVLVRGSVESLKLSGGELLNSNPQIQIDSPGGDIVTYQHAPAWVRLSDLVLDGGTGAGLVVNTAVLLSMTGVVATSNALGGFNISNVDTVAASSCQAVNNGAPGWSLGTGSAHVTLSGCTGTKNTGSGVSVAAGVSDFVIQGGSYSGTYPISGWVKVQAYGISVAAGASDRYVIADNLVSGNTTAGISDGGTGVNKRVANNY